MGDLDISRQEEWARRQVEAVGRRATAGDTHPLKSGDGGGTFDGMDARIKVLEYRAEQADKMFARIDSKLDALVKDVSEVKGRINAMPTTWQLLGMILAIMGASFAIIRFGLAGL